MNAETQLWADWFSNFLLPEEDPFEPATDLFYPIVDSLEQVNNGANAGETALVGMIAGSLYYRNLIRDILPTGSKGVVLVFESECAEAFTYQIDGPKVSYLGTGDVHDLKYDYLGVHSDIFDLKNYSIRGSRYTGAPIDEIFCPLTLHLYPSKTMHDQFATSNGLIFAFSAVAIFVFTSCELMDCCCDSVFFAIFDDRSLSQFFLLIFHSGVYSVRLLRGTPPKAGHEQSGAIFRNCVVLVSFSCS